MWLWLFSKRLRVCMQAWGLSSCLCLCPLGLGFAALHAVIEVGLLLSTWWHMGGVRATAVSDYIYFFPPNELLACSVKWVLPLFPSLSSLPVSAPSPPSRRLLRCRGRSQTPLSSTWPMTPLTASWRNILLSWSCSTPLVSNVQQPKLKRDLIYSFID